VFIGVAVRCTSNGIVYVAAQNGYELDELHNVSLPAPVSGEFLKYNGTLWIADDVDLGTDTTGDYVASMTGGTGVTVTGGTGEGSTPSVAIGQSVATSADPSFNTITSTVASGTAPLTVASNTVVTNLNSDLLDGQSGSYYLDLTNATGTLPVSKGGTGVTTAYQGGIAYGVSTTQIQTGAAGSAGQILTSGGTGAPAWITTVPIANGGTNSTATATAGGAGYGTGTAHAYTAAGTSGQVLQSNGASAPTWQGGAWTFYTPAISASAGSPTLGTSPVNNGYYVQIGKTVTGFIRTVLGTSPTSATAGATYYFSLPVAARQVIANTPCGTFQIINGSTFLSGLIIGVATDKFFFAPHNASFGTTTSIGALASGTQFNMFFTYEAA